MDKRINLQETQPQAYKAMYGLEGYLKTTQLTQTHRELIKIRASQINGCAYCIDVHTRDALKSGETAQRIFLLNAWKETPLFTWEESPSMPGTGSASRPTCNRHPELTLPPARCRPSPSH